MSEIEKHKPADGQRPSSRRTFLKGAGVTMALPWLESLPVWGAAAMAGDLPAPCPKRFAALFMGCGVNPVQWWAKPGAAGIELGPARRGGELAERNAVRGPLRHSVRRAR